MLLQRIAQGETERQSETCAQRRLAGMHVNLRAGRMTTEPRSLPHVGDDEAFIARLNDATQAMHRLPARHTDAGHMGAAQLAAMQVVCSSPDSETRAAQVANFHRNTCTPACRASGCNRQRPQRAGDTRDGEIQNDGNPAATKG